MTWPNWPLRLRTSSSHQEGVDRDWSVLARRVIGEGGEVTGLECVKVEWVNGQMQDVPGSTFTLKAVLILLAMGFVGPKKAGLLEQAGVKLSPRGNVDADTESYATSEPGVFACGDAARMAGNIALSVGEGALAGAVRAEGGPVAAPQAGAGSPRRWCI